MVVRIALTSSSTPRNNLLREQAHLLLGCIFRPEDECVEAEVSRPLRQGLNPVLDRTIQTLVSAPRTNRANDVVQTADLGRIATSRAGRTIDNGLGTRHFIGWRVDAQRADPTAGMSTD